MSPTEDLLAVHARILALELELELATEQLEALSFNVVFEEEASDSLPPPVQSLPPTPDLHPPTPVHLPPPFPQSPYRGVSWHRDTGKWRAQAARSKAGPQKHLGLFESDRPAASAWDDEARVRGLFHKLNFPTYDELQDL